MGIYDDYVRYTQKYKSEYGDLTMVLIEVGSFWEIYDCDKHLGADMKKVSEILNIQVTKKNKNIPQVSAANPLMAGFPSHALNRFLPLLLEADLTIVLVGQVTSPPNPERAVTQILSKGTYIDSFDVTNSNYIMSCSRVECGHIGASMIDLSTGTSYTFEGPLDNFIKMVQMYKPCEVIMEEGGAIVCEGKKYIIPEAFKKTLAYQTEILTCIFENDSMLTIIEYLDLEKSPLALASYVALVEFCNKHVPLVMRNLRKPVKLSQAQQLDVFYNTNDQLDVPGLCRVLNSCVTAMGRRYFKRRLLNPYCKVEDIERSLFKIKNMCIEEATRLRNALKQVYDLERLFRKVELGIVTLNEMENIGKSCMNLQAVVVAGGIFQHIVNTYDFDQGTVKNDSEVDSIVKKIAGLRDQGEQFIAKCNSAFGVSFFKMDGVCENGWYMSLTNKRWQDIQRHPSVGSFGLRGDKGTASCVKVTHSTLEELFVQYECASRELKDVVALKFKESIVTFNKLFQSSFSEIIDVVCDLDFTSTCVYNNNKYKYCCPELVECGSGDGGSFADFVGVRHPIIEIINDSEEYVGNDVCVGYGTRSGSGSEGGTLLYGLNASGKSSLMKAVGLNIIMAQCGMFVASAGLRLAPYESIFARISKADNLYEGQSTFMIEMSELRKILKYSSNKSIVLADELCAGTESVSAISIVAAAIKTLSEKNCSFIFATHLHELTKIKAIENCSNIFHLDTTYDKATGSLVYNRKLRPGQGSELYGLEVCKSLDMDTMFLSIAEDVRSGLMKGMRKSKYNKKLIVNKCVICKEPADEVHHIKEQHLADKDGYIEGVHKNKLFNLAALCKSCHTKIHNNEITVEGYKMTGRGRNLVFSQNTLATTV